MSPSKRDKLFSKPLESIADFVFDQSVADVFQDMVERSIPGYQTSIYAIDNSEAMLAKCATVLASKESNTRTHLVNANICDIEITNASLVVMNFTLQFIPLEQRSQLMHKIYQGLNKGGCLVISEKLHFEPESLNQLLCQLHHQFKREQGYSDLEISQKRDSIENVLLPETLETHIGRLKSSGFSTVSPWFQCFNFGSLIAIK
jgi:tRNA (cmo5U34)-methyltransferase